MATAAGGDRAPEPGLPASAALDDLLECPICLQCLQLPTVVTPCGHTYCRNCLQASYGGRSSIR
jgi:E3 ubiquitin-protein ligase SH3RF